MNMNRSGYCTDERLLDAIEAVSGDDLWFDDETGEMSAAHMLWDDGGKDNEIRVWLDANYPEWKNDAPLAWGWGEFK